MSNRAKPTKKDSMFSKEDIHHALDKVNNPETRCSQRNIDRGINKRGVDPHSSRRSQPGPSDQPQATCERYERTVIVTGVNYNLTLVLHKFE